MKELKIEHLAPYLPYGVKCAFIIRDEIVKVGVLNKVIINSCETHPVRYSIDTLNELEHEWMFKPILHPLSDLTKEIEHNGKKILPWKEINELINGEYSPYFNHIEVNEWGGLRINFGDHSTGYSIIEANKVIQKLLEWHFDIYGLIEQNLAIEK